jgi:hypothetical protein
MHAPQNVITMSYVTPVRIARPKAQFRSPFNEYESRIYVLHVQGWRTCNDGPSTNHGACARNSASENTIFCGKCQGRSPCAGGRIFRHSLFMYVCVHIYIYIHTYMHPFMYVHVCMCACMRSCFCVYVCKCVNARMYVHTRIHAYIHSHIYVSMFLCICMLYIYMHERWHRFHIVLIS